MSPGRTISCISCVRSLITIGVLAFLFWGEVIAQLRNLLGNVRDTESACGTPPRNGVVIGWENTKIHIK